MPRVLNLSLAAVLLLLLAPIVTNLGGKPVYVQVALVGLTLLFGSLAALCLASALRPGSLGRTVRRMRRRR